MTDTDRERQIESKEQNSKPFVLLWCLRARGQHLGDDRREESNSEREWEKKRNSEADPQVSRNTHTHKFMQMRLSLMFTKDSVHQMTQAACSNVQYAFILTHT